MEPAAAVQEVAEDRTAAILAYLTFIGFIVAVILNSSKKTSVGAFHLRQALGLFLTGLVAWPAYIVLAFIPFIGWLAMIVIVFGLLAFWVMGLVGAAQGTMRPVPFVGDLYQRIFSGAFN